VSVGDPRLAAHERDAANDPDRGIALVRLGRGKKGKAIARPSRSRRSERRQEAKFKVGGEAICICGIGAAAEPPALSATIGTSHTSAMCSRGRPARIAWPCLRRVYQPATPLGRGAEEAWEAAGQTNLVNSGGGRRSPWFRADARWRQGAWISRQTRWRPLSLQVRLVKDAYVKLTGALAVGEPTTSPTFSLVRDLLAAVSLVGCDLCRRLQNALLLAHGSLTIEQLLGVRPDSLG
jgi:hypothetical protein